MSNFIVPISILAAFLFIGIVAAKLYTRSRQDRAFVRTGLGGKKVVQSGGAMVIPVFQEIVWVNTNTIKLQVTRQGEDSLITNDRLRVDVSVEFYLKVANNEQAIATAAQTLGDKTEKPEDLKILIEGKLVDALRSAASTMKMADLHEKRPEFISQVKGALTEDLTKNGLELEAVSLTSLNQTNLKFFKEDNAFDAEGLRILTNAIQESKKARNEIEQNAAVEIATKNKEATEKQLAIEKQVQDATLTTRQEIAQKTADTDAQIKKSVATKNLEAAEVEIKTNQEIETQKLDAQAIILGKERAIIQSKQEVDTQRITSETAVKTKDQEAQITLADKSKEVATAKSLANEVLATEIATQESITTAQEVAIANRNKAVALVKAEEAAQQEAIQVKVAAEADLAAAEFQAKAVKESAMGDRDAALFNAEGIKAVGEAEASALQAKNEAANTLGVGIIEQQVKMAVLAALPAIIQASVEPLKNIDSIRIAEVGGLTGSGNSGQLGGVAGGGSKGGSNLGNEVVDAALKYQVGKDLIGGLMSSVGIANGSLDALVASALTATTGSQFSAGLPTVDATPVVTTSAAAVSSKPAK